MADGHPSSCAHATIGSVCHCECSGVRHSTAINAGVPAPASAVKGAKGTPTEGKVTPKLPLPNETSAQQTQTPPATEPEPAPEPEPPAPTFDERIANARTDAEARAAAPASLERPNELSSEEAAGLDAYREETYAAINHVLRGGDESEVGRWYATPDQVRDWTAGIDEAMDRSRLTDDAQVWRGISNGSIIFGDRMGGDLTGTEWQEDAYVSTSSDRTISEGFAGDYDDSVLMRILAPRGVGAVELSDEGYESELMLQRGLRMRVVADRGRDEDGVRYLDVEVIPA